MCVLGSGNFELEAGGAGEREREREKREKTLFATIIYCIMYAYKTGEMLLFKLKI